MTGFDFLTSRKSLQKGRVLVFSGQAMDVLRVRNIFISAGLDFTIEPDFNWD